jgi:hypothetical protein
MDISNQKEGMYGKRQVLGHVMHYCCHVVCCNGNSQASLSLSPACSSACFVVFLYRAYTANQFSSQLRNQKDRKRGPKGGAAQLAEETTFLGEFYWGIPSCSAPAVFFFSLLGASTLTHSYLRGH